jgi:hypothetical protein
MSEALFKSYENPDGEKSPTVRWAVILICIGLCLVGGISGVLIWNNHVIAKFGPYRDKVRRLHGGMSGQEVVDAIGDPYNPANQDDREILAGTYRWQRSWDENGEHVSYWYRAAGPPLPLTLEFSPRGSSFETGPFFLDSMSLSRWCYDSACHDFD